MMELNKYDLAEWVALNLKGVLCEDCPITQECKEREYNDYICFDKEETKELLIKKYNL
jgi:hypothetical protein